MQGMYLANSYGKRLDTSWIVWCRLLSAVVCA